MQIGEAVEEKPSEAEFLEIFRQIDEPVQAAFAEAVTWLAQLPAGQPWPSSDEVDAIIRSIVERNEARENGTIN
jgi:hypothetical protein